MQMGGFPHLIVRLAPIVHERDFLPLSSTIVKETVYTSGNIDLCTGGETPPSKPSLRKRKSQNHFWESHHL